MGFQDNPGNILGADSNNNQFSSTNVVANADGSIIERLEHLKDAVGAVGATPGNFAWGLADAGTNSTTAIAIDELAGYGDDFFNNKFYMQILHNADSAGNAPEAQVRKITDYVSATGTFTCDAFGAAVGASDICVILHESLVALGRDDADNVFASTNVAANADGSILERLEAIKDQIDAVDNYVDTEIATIQAELSGAAGIAAFPAGAAPANGVSMAEVLRDIWDAVRNGTGGTEPGTNRSIVDEIKGAALNYGGVNYLAVPITFAAGTTGSVATHEILTVTGAVRLRMFIECTTSLEGSGTIQLGVAGATDGFIAATTGTDIDAGDIWYDATPAETYGNFSSLVLDKVIAGGLDVGYEIAADTLTGGVVVFHCWWEPLNSTGAVVAADGTGTL